MASRKTSNKLQRQDHIEQVGRMRLRGMTQLEIGKLLGISQVMVSYNERKAREQMVGRLEQSHKENINTTRLQYEEIRREAWIAYEKSMKDADKEVEEYGIATDEDGGSIIGSEVKLKRIVTKEGRLPANHYLQTIIQTLKAERELLGLDVPVETKTESSVSISFPWETLYERKPVIDVVAEKVKALALDQQPKAAVSLEELMNGDLK